MENDAVYGLPLPSSAGLERPRIWPTVGASGRGIRSAMAAASANKDVTNV